MLSPNKTIIAQKLLANLGVFMRHSSTVEPTTIFPTKKLNESAMKKWAIVSPSVLPCQIVSIYTILHNIHISRIFLD